jgi:hypothetical protein
MQCDIDDAASVMASEERHGALGEQERRLEIDGHDLAQDVEAPGLGDRMVDQVFAVGLRSEIALPLPDLLHRFVERARELLEALASASPAITRYPSSTNRLTIAFPMPPVITAVLLVHSGIPVPYLRARSPQAGSTRNSAISISRMCQTAGVSAAS